VHEAIIAPQETPQGEETCGRAPSELPAGCSSLQLCSHRNPGRRAGTRHATLCAPRSRFVVRRTGRERAGLTVALALIKSSSAPSAAALAGQQEASHSGADS
jgi:hypothetical protein